MIVERTLYFAKPGRAADVFAIRQKASRVRVSIGLQAGDIFKRAVDEAKHPDVMWECSFADAASHAADLAARAASPDFEAVRKEMRGAIDDFSRIIMERTDYALANGMRSISLQDFPIVPEEIAFSSGGYNLKGYLYLPPGKGPFPCLITNHGSTIEKGTLDVSRPGTAALLMSWGIASFLPHRRGYGNSEGPAWREEVTGTYGTPEYDAQLVERLDKESDDVLAALALLRRHPSIDRQHMGVFGSSFGGTTTLFAASKSRDLTCAVDFAGAAMNWDKTPALRAAMTKAALQLTMPIYLIQAANDYSIRPTKELSAALSEAGKPMESRLYPDFGFNNYEGHLLERGGAQLWAAEVRSFLERHL
jgi:carboxymethylenebutenolidase